MITGSQLAEQQARAQHKPSKTAAIMSAILLSGIALISGGLVYLYIKDWISL